ncbi:MAG TPA: ABC transporter permease subunit, partial [Phycisphaerae bacterium]|nr:ABC transporter permease subunit [Phycisphaerae bacterium]
MRQSLSYKHAGLTGSTFGQKRHRFSWSVGLAGVLTALFCLVLVWPFIFGAGWQELLHPALSSDDWQAVAVSVLCASADAALMIVLATPLAWILARRQFRGKFFLEGLALVPLLTPPLALGMLLANVLGPQSTIGQIARHFDITLTNSIPALIIAGFYAAAPFYVFGAKLAFQAVSPGYEEMAGLLGKSRMAAWFTVTLPLALGGLFWALLIGWLRALGEFGVAIIIAYFPHGIPIQMWVNLQDIGPQAVYPLLWMLILVAMPVP